MERKVIAIYHSTNSCVFLCVQFSTTFGIGFMLSRDQAFVRYEHQLERIVSGLEPLLDKEPVSLHAWSRGTTKEKLSNLSALRTFFRAGMNFCSEIFAILSNALPCRLS